MNNKKSPFFLIVFVLFLVCFADATAGTLQDIKMRGRLVAGVRTDLIPFGYVNKKGMDEGFDIDISREIAKELFGKKDAVKFVRVTKANGVDLLNEKKIDVLLGGLIIGGLPKDVIDYSNPYFESGYLILARDDSTIARYQDLVGKSVAIIRGSTADTVIKNLVPQANRIAFSDPSQVIQALKKRRVDAFADTAIMVIHLERQNPGLKIAGYEPFGSVDYGLGVRKGDKEWLAFLNTALQKMKDTGQYQKLREKWFAESLALLLGFKKPEITNKAKKNNVK
jgi:putative glutamine transport system substrate-binding protein